MSDVRLRISYDRAIRAPSFMELYTPLLYGVSQINGDPCAPADGGATQAAASRAVRVP